MSKLVSKLLLVLMFCTNAAFAIDLDQAKADGLVGERADGYLGLVVPSAGADVVKLVADINSKRKAEFERIAQTNDLTLEQVQALAGKKALERTKPGGWILVNGGWQQK